MTRKPFLEFRIFKNATSLMEREERLGVEGEGEMRRMRYGEARGTVGVVAVMIVLVYVHM
jgi:polyisoprenoid-binding protein YceI